MTQAELRARTHEAYSAAAKARAASELSAEACIERWPSGQPVNQARRAAGKLGAAAAAAARRRRQLTYARASAPDPDAYRDADGLLWRVLKLEQPG